jgi:hypothetical protein
MGMIQATDRFAVPKNTKGRFFVVGKTLRALLRVLIIKQLETRFHSS